MTYNLQPGYAQPLVTNNAYISHSDPNIFSLTIHSEDYSKNYYLKVNTMNPSQLVTAYDDSGNMLSCIKHESSYLVQYDSSEKILAKNNIEEIKNATNAISPTAQTWDEKIFVQSNTNVDNSNEANVAAMLIGIILALTGVGAVIAIAATAIQFIANYVVINKLSTIWYKGWYQYGWRVIRYNLDYYQYSNYTGFIKNVSAMQGVH